MTAQIGFWKSHKHLLYNMAAKNLTIGANYISEVDLVDSDGNSVTLADIGTYSVEIWQHRRLIETIPTGAKLTAGTTASKLKIEISEATSLKFREGMVIARVVGEKTNILYTADGVRISLPDYHILTMYIQLPEDEEAVTTVIDHYRGLYDASGNVQPTTGGAGTGGAILGGDYWIINVAGTIFGIPVNVGNTITSKINNPGATSGNWTITGNMS